MPKALILSDESELIENIDNFFNGRIVLEKNKQKKLNDYDIFIFDDVEQAKINELTMGTTCIININSNFSIKNQHNFKKPFRLSEVLKTLDNFVKFYEENVIDIKNIGKFNPRDRYIIIENKNIGLTEKESELMQFLYRNKGGTREKILQGIWKRGEDSDGKVLDTIFYGLKQKLKSFAIKKNLIILENNCYKLEE